MRTDLRLPLEEGEAESYTVEVEPLELTAEECRALLQEDGGRDGKPYPWERTLPSRRCEAISIWFRRSKELRSRWSGSWIIMRLSSRTELSAWKNLTEEGSLTELTARLTCGEEESVYRAVVCAYPPLLTEEEKWRRLWTRRWRKDRRKQPARS